MSKKLNKIVIIVFATVLVSSIFYGINKFNQKENYIEASSKNSKETNCLLDINNYKSVRCILDDKNNKENKEDEETKSNYKYVTWNLQSLYPSDEAWEKELSKFEKDISELDNYTGKVTKSKTHFISALKIKEKLDIKLEKLYAYAKLNKDINKNSYKYLDMINKIGTVDSKYSRICSDLELEILKLPDSTYNEYLKSKNKKAKVFVIHRLDKDTSGVLMFAKNEKIKNKLQNNWNKIVNAVNATQGKIITYNNEPINAFFHSNSGGKTEIPINVWGGSGMPYLQVVETSGEENYSQYSSEVTISKEELKNKMLEKYQDFTIDFNDSACIGILEYTESGRVKTIKIGNKNLSGVEARTNS